MLDFHLLLFDDGFFAFGARFLLQGVALFLEQFASAVFHGALEFELPAQDAAHVPRPQAGAPGSRAGPHRPMRAHQVSHHGGSTWKDTLAVAGYHVPGEMPA